MLIFLYHFRTLIPRLQHISKLHSSLLSSLSSGDCSDNSTSLIVNSSVLSSACNATNTSTVNGGRKRKMRHQEDTNNLTLNESGPTKAGDADNHSSARLAQSAACTLLEMCAAVMATKISTPALVAAATQLATQLLAAGKVAAVTSITTNEDCINTMP